MLVGVDVVADETRVRQRAQREATDGADLAVEVHERDVALGRAVELQDARDAEALLERLPDVGAQTVAGGDPDRVVAVVLARRLVHQVAAELPDVLEGGGIVAAHVVPEVARAELAPQRHGGARREHARDEHHAAGRVVERERAVVHVVRTEAERGRRSVAGAEEAQVAEARRLRQAGRAGGVDVEDVVAAAHVGAQSRRGIRVRLIGERGDQVARAGGGRVLLSGWHRVAVEPDLEILELVPHGREAVGAVGAEHQVARARGLERVSQRPTRQVGVDQGRRHPDLRETHPDGHVLGPVLHHERDDVAASEPEAVRPVGDPVRGLVQLAVAPGALLEAHEGAARVARSPRLEQIGNGLTRLRAQPDHAREHPREAKDHLGALEHTAKRTTSRA
jgi:hypothetical protein